MLKEKHSLKNRSTINAIQNGMFYMLFVLLPFCIIPLPWDWIERGTSLLILMISTVIISLEIFKFIWEGKVSISKSSIDIGILLFLLASIISTIFSVDMGLSFWGVDMNLGSGFISLLAIILLSFTMRIFIDTSNEVSKVLKSFYTGISIINIFSLLSFFNIDFLRHLPAYEDIFTYGLPWTLSAPTLLILNGVLITTSLGILFLDDRKRKDTKIFVLLPFLISIITILLFSINQGFTVLLVLLIALSLLVFLTLKDIKIQKSRERDFRLLALIPFLLLTISFLFLRIPTVKDKILDSFQVLTQMSLGTDISWEIVSSGLSSQLSRAIVGFGENTFAILYNLFKPATDEILALNNSNFFHGSSEILTQLGEGGIIKVVTWILLGYLLVKEFFGQIRKMLKTRNTEKEIFSLTLGISSLFVYTLSFFYDFGVIIYLIFFINISLWIISSSLNTRGLANKLIFRTWVVDTGQKKLKDSANSVRSINIVLSTLLFGVTLLAMTMWCKTLISNIYIASAEYSINTESIELSEDSDFEDRESLILKLLDRYSKAESFEERNSLVNRKLALLNLEMVSLYVEEYGFTEDENKKEEILNSISVYKREVINQGQKAVDRNPELYDNWETMASSYMGLLSLGFEDYDRDSLEALSKAVDLNPINYELYYNAAQVYLVQENTEDALTMLIESLQINPRYIPTILLTADVNKDLGKVEVYLSYLEAAKAIMEEYDQTDTEIYQEVLLDIEEAEAKE